MNDDMNQVFPGLYIGNQTASASYGAHFDMVVNCTPTVPFAPRQGGLTVRIAIDDDPRRNPEMLQVACHSGILEKMHEILSQPNKTVLVHCHAGMQRSCAIVAFYVMKFYGLDVPEAMAFIQRSRKIAFYRGATFLPALDEFYRRLLQ
jgi:protein-tyrosine phosphatase